MNPNLAGQMNASRTGQAATAPRECAANEVKQQLRELATLVADNTRRCVQIGARLGYHSPKNAEDNAPTPVPNGHFDEMRQMIASIHGAAVEAVDYLNAIERQV